MLKVARSSSGSGRDTHPVGTGRKGIGKGQGGAGGEREGGELPGQWPGQWNGKSPRGQRGQSGARRTGGYSPGAGCTERAADSLCCSKCGTGHSNVNK